MFIDVVRPENWEELNDKVKTSLGLSAKIRARCFNGINQAVFEISQGTAQFMSHKKAIGVIQGQTAAFDGLLPYYYKETYEVAVLSHTQLDNVKEWVESLKKETCFVLFAEDHPVTGELYPFADELDKLLNEKRIFSFKVSHANHLHSTNEVRPYSVRLCSFDPNTAVAILGERFRSPSLLAHSQNWDKETFLKNLVIKTSVDPMLIENFEKEISAVATPFFKSNQARLFDRAICVFNDVSAEALAERIFAKLQISKVDGYQKILTPNMCHWAVIKMFRHWWEPAPSLEQLRGMLIFTPEVLQIKDFAKLVITSYEEIKAEQSWSL